MLWLQTKTPNLKESGYEFTFKKLTHPSAEHTTVRMINFVPCIIIPPVFGKHKELYLPKELKAPDTRISRHKIQYYYLYQIVCLLVKEKSLILN